MPTQEGPRNATRRLADPAASAMAGQRTGLGRPRSGGMGSPAFVWTHPRRLERRMGTERRAVRFQPVRLRRAVRSYAGGSIRLRKLAAG
jgi:hypothetical protein